MTGEADCILLPVSNLIKYGKLHLHTPVCRHCFIRLSFTAF